MGEPLIQLVSDAVTELGLPAVQFVINATDNTGRQFGGLANRVGRLLMRMHDWTFLTGLWNFTVPQPQTAQGVVTQQGSTTISGFQSAFIAGLLPNQMLVSGNGLMTSTRLVATNLGLGTVTLDQPANASGTVDITFQQDAFPLPPDWERAIDRTAWDRSMRWETRLVSPQQDQWVRSGIVATGPRRQYRQIDSMWRIWPPPSANYQGGQLITEYISSNWVTSAAGVGQGRFLNDQDVAAFPDDIMVMGLMFQFMQVKGFQSDALEKRWYNAVRNAISVDGPSATLDMARRQWPTFISSSNVADSGFGASTPFGNP